MRPKYYEALVESDVRSNRGKLKKIRELFLIDAESMTETEIKIQEYFKQLNIPIDYNIKFIKESKIIELIS